MWDLIYRTKTNPFRFRTSGYSQSANAFSDKNIPLFAQEALQKVVDQSSTIFLACTHPPQQLHSLHPPSHSSKDAGRYERVVVWWWGGGVSS